MSISDPPVYLVIGATGGIGTELCRRLVQRQARLMLAARTEAPLIALAEELQQPYRLCDASNWQSLEQCVQAALDQYGRIDGATNLAGSILLKPAHLTSLEDLQHCVNQNLVTSLGLLRYVSEPLRKSGGGSIVLMSSAAADIGLMGHEAIAACKAGVAAMARSAAATYAASNIRVNSVAPGLVRTPLTKRVWGSEKSAEASLGMHPLGRLGESSDIASAIDWLLHPDQTWITGQQICVDGGLSSLKSLNR